jgi:hypothetical protein
MKLYNTIIKPSGIQVGEIIKLGNIQGELISSSKDGDGKHMLLKVVHNGCPLALKCYGLKRGRASSLLRHWLAPYGLGKSRFGVLERLKTEREVLQLWRMQGFDVPALLVPDFMKDIRQPCTSMEWIPGRTLDAVLRCEETPFNLKRDVVAGFFEMMGRRHERALALREVRLLCEHPTCKHIIISDGHMAYIDFEVVYTPKKDLERVLRHEIAGFLYSIAKASKAQFPELLQVVFSSYPDSSRLNRVMDELRRFGTVPIHGWLEKFQKFFPLIKKYKKISAGARGLGKTMKIK